MRVFGAFKGTRSAYLQFECIVKMAAATKDHRQNEGESVNCVVKVRTQYFVMFVLWVPYVIFSF